jgi:hypothetical protein
VLVSTAFTGDPQAPEIVPSDHCVKRYRERMAVRTPGLDDVVTALVRTLEDAIITRWPPGWAVTDRPPDLWAIAGELAFPLASTDRPGRYLAVTCLRRDDHSRR